MLGGRLLRRAARDRRHAGADWAARVGRRAGGAARRAADAAHDRVRRLRRRHLRRARARRRPPAEPPPHQPRQRLWRIVAKRAVLAAGAIERPHRVRRQRPAGRHAGRRGAHLRQPLRGRRRAARVAVFTDNDDGWRTARDLARAGRRGRGRRRRRAPTSAAARRRSAAARVIARRRGRRDAAAARGCARSTCATRGGHRDASPATRSPCPAAGIPNVASRPAIAAAGRSGTTTSRPSSPATAARA